MPEAVSPQGSRRGPFGAGSLWGRGAHLSGCRRSPRFPAASLRLPARTSIFTRDLSCKTCRGEHGNMQRVNHSGPTGLKINPSGAGERQLPLPGPPKTPGTNTGQPRGEAESGAGTGGGWGKQYRHGCLRQNASKTRSKARLPTPAWGHKRLRRRTGTLAARPAATRRGR